MSLSNKDDMTVKITKTHIVCPGCNKPGHTIDHLYDPMCNDLFDKFPQPLSHQKFYCDFCGDQYSFTVAKKNSELIVSDVKLTGEKLTKCLVLLKKGDIGIVVKGSRVDDKLGSHQYHERFYNRHPHPHLYLREAKGVFDLKHKDTDPDCIFEYVATLPYDDRIDELNDHEFKKELIKKYE